uniref:Ycf55-like protein n=1 Tax=Anthurium amnicola TaxID=1678845 RepID=A0A1D1ZA61_9ARAE
MAECTSLPSCTLPWLRRTHNKANVPIPKVLYSGVLERKLLCGKHELIGRLPLQKYNTGYPFICTGVKGGHHLKRNNLRRCWFGTLTNPENLTPSDWFPVMDELLLTVSIVLAYMAGVVPSRKSLFNARKKQVGQDIGVEDYTASGRAAERGSQTNASDSWSEVKRKLTDALDGFEHVGNLDKKVVDCENCSTNSSLSLFAIAKGPRLRLLWVTLQRLHNEVISTSQTYEVVSRDFWLSVSCQIIQRMIQPICMEWLEYELSLEKDKQDKELVAKAFKKLWENDSMLQRFKELGKAELYADLLFFLRFGFLSDGHNFGDRFLSEHGVDVLEDLVICLADGVSSMYLELISVDSNMTNEMNSLGLHLCFLSTRELQRIRNEVALKQWMQQNFESIVSMYEDRFDLFVLQTKCLQKPSQMEIQEHNWWQKFAFNKPKSDFLHYVWISQMHVHVKRTKELRALTGWRYYFSLFLELSDVAMPLFRVVFTKASNAVSFFLTSLIGRSLGLIYTGIRQSLGWR